MLLFTFQCLHFVNKHSLKNELFFVTIPDLKAVHKLKDVKGEI